MARVKSKVLKFDPPTTPDVVMHQVFVDQPGQLSYESPHVAGTDFYVHDDGKVHADLAGMDIMRTLDGVYDVGLVFVDDVGNQSDMTRLESVALDFTAPDAPTGLSIV